MDIKLGRKGFRLVTPGAKLWRWAGDEKESKIVKDKIKNNAIQSNELDISKKEKGIEERELEETNRALEQAKLAKAKKAVEARKIARAKTEARELEEAKRAEKEAKLAKERKAARAKEVFEERKRAKEKQIAKTNRKFEAKRAEELNKLAEAKKAAEEMKAGALKRKDAIKKASKNISKAEILDLSKTDKNKKKGRNISSKQEIAVFNQRKSNSSMRTCTLCNSSKPLTKEFFGHTPKGGYRFQCRACINKRSREWAIKNPQKINQRSIKRKIEANFWTPSDQLVRDLYAEQEGICALCGEKMSKDYFNKDYCQVEHLLPVSRGGSNGNSNLVLAHRTCNQEKANKTLKEYFEWRQKVGAKRSSYFSEKIINALSK